MEKETEVIHVRIDSDLVEKLRKICVKEGRTIAGIIRITIEKFIKSHKS